MTMPGAEMQFGSIFAGGAAAGLGAAQLLDRFAATRDEAAFAALVARHGPMVLATCRRMLPDRADADDAFQATFLILARRAGTIADPDRLAPWLHGVVRRVAARARAQGARRQAVEGDGVAADDVAVLPPPADAFELRSIFDDELARLPAKYRDPLVLCYLEGLTQDEAASQLRWPLGTVRSRLAGGRERLRIRLARRGFAPGALAVLSPATLPVSAVSPALQVATARLILGAGPQVIATSSAAVLAQGVLTTMLLAKVQTAAVATLAVAATLAAGTAGVVIARQEPAAKPQPVAAAPPKPDPGLIDSYNADRELHARLKEEIATMSRQLEQLSSDKDEKVRQYLALKEVLAVREEEAKAVERAMREKVIKLDAGLTLAPVGPATTRPVPATLLDGDLAAVGLANELGEARERIKALEAELATMCQAVRPEPTPAPGGATKPDPRPEVRLVPDSPLLMTISAERDRITMVNPATQQRAILQLDRAVTRVEPAACMHQAEWISLKLEGPAITKLAVFETAAMRWHERTLARPVTFAYPNAQTSRSRVPFHLEGADVAEAVVFDLESRTWISEPLRGGPQQRLTTGLFYDPSTGFNPKFTVVSQAGRFFYFLSPTEPRWTVPEVKRAPVYGPQAQQMTDFDRVIAVPGLQPLPDGSLCVQDDNDLIFYNPKTAELTRVDTATEK